MSSSRTLDKIVPYLLSGSKNKTLEQAVASVNELKNPLDVLSNLKARYKNISGRDLPSYNEMLLLEKFVQVSENNALIEECQKRIVKLIQT